MAVRLARAPRCDAAVALRLAPPPGGWTVLAPGLARAGLRRDHGGHLQHRRLARFVRGPGVPDAGAVPGTVAHPRGELATTRGRTTPSPARTSTTSTRSTASSIDTCAAPTTAGTRSPRSSGSSTSSRRPSPSRGHSRDGGGRPAPTRIRRPRSMSTSSATARSEPGRSGIDQFAHRPTTGTRGALSWGAGGAPNGLARDLRRDEDAGPTWTSEPLSEPLEVARRARGRAAPGGRCAGRDRQRPPLRRRARWHDVPRECRRAEPDPPSLACRSGADATRRRRGGAGAPADRRLPMAPRASIRVAISSSLWPVLWPSPFPATFELHRGPAAPSRLELPVVPPAGGPGDAPVPAFRTESPSLRWPEAEARDGRGPAVADPPVWRIDEDVIAGTDDGPRP